MLSILIPKNTRAVRNLEGDGFLYSIDCVDGFMGVYLFSNSIEFTLNIIAFCVLVIPQ